MRNFRILLIGFLLLMTFGCTQTGEHSWGVTVDSIKAAVKHGKFFVTASDMKESPIPEPEKGQIVLFGYMDYGGYYDNDRGKPSEPETDVGGPMAWDNFEGSYIPCFFAGVIDEQSGEIVKARVYYRAINGRNYDFEADMRDKLNGSFGKIGKNNFAFSVSGPQWYYAESRGEGSRPAEPTDFQTAVVMGNGDVLTAANGATFPAKLYIGVKDIPKKYPVRKDGNGIITFGSGNLKVIRYQGK